MGSALLLAVVFTVVSGADGGEGSLRSAIERANMTPGRDTIAASSSFRVQLNSPLPPITESVIITGPAMTLDGSHSGAGDGLVITGDDVTIRAINVTHMNGNGITVSGRNNQVNGGFSSENGGFGAVLTATATRNVLTGTISAIGFGTGPMSFTKNAVGGVRIDGIENQLQFSIVGDNGGDGVTIAGTDNTVRYVDSDRNDGSGFVLRTPTHYGENRGACNRDGLLNVDHAIAAPVLTGAIADQFAYTIYGTVHGEASTTYLVDLITFGGFCPSVDVGGESVLATTNEQGVAVFQHSMLADGQVGHTEVGAVATRELDGVSGTSLLSTTIPITPAAGPNTELAISAKGPAVASPGSDVVIQFFITNRGPAAALFSHTKLTTSAGATESKLEPNRCFADDCTIPLLGPGETQVLTHTLHVTGAAGTTLIDEATVRPSSVFRQLDFDPNDNTAKVRIEIVPRRRAAGR